MDYWIKDSQDSARLIQLLTNDIWMQTQFDFPWPKNISLNPHICQRAAWFNLSSLVRPQHFKFKHMSCTDFLSWIFDGKITFVEQLFQSSGAALLTSDGRQNFLKLVVRFFSEFSRATKQFCLKLRILSERIDRQIWLNSAYLQFSEACRYSVSSGR